MSKKSVYINIVTTAAPPWRTGTAINPTLRAVYLSELGYSVCVIFPWLDNTKDQFRLYERVFNSQWEQAAYIREWILRNSNSRSQIDLLWYDAVYEPNIGCIIQKNKEDITCIVPSYRRDIVILEEPEHLNWFHCGQSWARAYAQVIGIVHTNYTHYATARDGWLRGTITSMCFTKLLHSAYTAVNIHLSAATCSKTSSHNVVCNVNGVRSIFFDIDAPRHDAVGYYFIGKALWSKGYDELVRLYANCPNLPALSSFGSGEDYDNIVNHIGCHGLRIMHAKAVDHTSDTLMSFRTFVNPSKSEGVCTTTSEALAMGKYVILPVHKSNKFFRRFRNAIFYDSDDDFKAAMEYVCSRNPFPLSDAERQLLTWEGATQRLLRIASTVSARQEWGANLAYVAHHYILGSQPMNNILRRAVGVHVLSIPQEEKMRIAIAVMVFVLAIARTIIRGRD